LVKQGPQKKRTTRVMRSPAKNLLGKGTDPRGGSRGKTWYEHDIDQNKNKPGKKKTTQTSIRIKFLRGGVLEVRARRAREGKNSRASSEQ